MNTWNVKKSVTDTRYTVHKHFQQISYTFLVRFSGQFTNAVIALNLKNWYCQRDMEKWILLLKIHLISYLMKHTGQKFTKVLAHTFSTAGRLTQDKHQSYQQGNTWNWHGGRRRDGAVQFSLCPSVKSKKRLRSSTNFGQI